MAEDDRDPTVMDFTATIVTSYLHRNQVAASDLSMLITSVYRAFAGLGAPVELPEPRVPAVPVRRSVERDHVICLECGYRAKVLRRHLAVQHSLTADEYRARWNLQSDHPITAPTYAESRSTMAKAIGLGRKARVPRPEAAQLPEASPPKRRGRPRSVVAP